jgi:cell wall-active antibiotic response 4TMS protein YvqF
MNDQSAYLCRAVTGPIILITIGVLFAFDRFTDFRFSQTWPVLLIVIGLLRLAGGGRRRQYRDFPPPPPPSGGPGNFQEPGARS